MTSQKKQSSEAAVREIRRRTRRKFSPEDKICIVLEGLRGEQSVSDLCQGEGVTSLLLMKQGLPRSEQEAACRKHSSRSHQ